MIDYAGDADDVDDDDDDDDVGDDDDDADDDDDDDDGDDEDEDEDDDDDDDVDVDDDVDDDDDDYDDDDDDYSKPILQTLNRESRNEATLFELVYGLHVWHRQIAYAGFYRWARTKWNNTDLHTSMPGRHKASPLPHTLFVHLEILTTPPVCRKIHHGRRQGKCSAISSTTETALMFQGSCPKSSTTWLRKASLADFNMTPKDKIPNAAQDLKPLQPGALVHPPTVSDPGLWPHSQKTQA